MFRYSLLSLIVAITVVSIFAYSILPVDQEILGDIQYLDRYSVGDKCDVYGRNKTGAFQLVLRNVSVVSVEGSKNLKRGQSVITLHTTVRERQRLSRYEILQVRDVK